MLTIGDIAVVDTVGISSLNPLYPYLVPYDWETVFYVENGNKGNLLVNIKLYTFFNQYRIDLAKRSYASLYIPPRRKRKLNLEEIKDYRNQSIQALAGFTNLRMQTTFRRAEPLRTPTDSINTVTGEQGLIWEGVCGDPAFIAQVWHLGAIWQSIQARIGDGRATV